jgi:hypothetical protein
VKWDNGKMAVWLGIGNWLKGTLVNWKLMKWQIDEMATD